MVTFVTLFLGLMLGAHSVQVRVDESVAQVDLLLDGKLVCTMEEEPWACPCDFGQRLEPHRLIAVARDEEGQELGREHQLVNMPRGMADVRIALLGGDKARYGAVQLIWKAVGDLEPNRVEVFFDGLLLEVEDPNEIPLPRYDANRSHHVYAELDFPGGLQAEAVAAFGGTYSDEVKTELTPLVIRVDEPGTLPPREQMQGWFNSGDEALRVFAVDQPPARVILLRDRNAESELIRMGYLGQRPEDRRQLREYGIRGGLTKGDLLYLLPTVPSRRFEGSKTAGFFFHLSPNVPGQRSEAIWRSLTQVDIPAQLEGQQRLADAVAAAGLAATFGARPRAVVLVLDPSSQDSSLAPISLVRGYLDSLNVPLRTWCPIEELAPSQREIQWGAVEDISRRQGLGRALRQLRKTLDSQHVVWLEGSYLPTEVELSQKAAEFVSFPR